MLIASVLLASKTSPVRHPKGELSTLLIHEQDGGLLHPVGTVAWGAGISTMRHFPPRLMPASSVARAAGSGCVRLRR